MVIPTRDRWHLLSTAALPSALCQEAVELELIIVDDGSRDETPRRLADVTDGRLRVLRHERPLGVAQARNAGIAAADGAWVAFLDDDDLWSPRKLRRQLDAVAEAGASFVYTDGAAVDSQRRCLFSVESPDPERVGEELLRWNVMWGGSSNVMARTELVRTLGGFDEHLFQLADWDLWIRLALAGRAASCTDVLVAYSIHERNMLLTDRRDVFPEMDYLVDKHRDSSEAFGIDFDRALFSRWVAVGHRRAGRRLQATHTYLDGARRYGDLGAVPRAFGSLLGEPAVRLFKRLTGGKQHRAGGQPSADEPAWLARYR